MFDLTLQLIGEGVGIAYPCAAVAIGRGHAVFAREFMGKRQTEPAEIPLTEDTLFDIASLSKLVATTMIALKFIDSKKISLYDRVGSFFDNAGNFADCRIFDLLTHTSGIQPGIPLYDGRYKNEDPCRVILDSERCCETGKEVFYSCMGYILLGRILEKVGGEPLDKLAEKYVFSPLGMQTACYNPKKGMPVAATEKYAATGEWATGHVHDENAYFLGGVSGNAGVFASLDDMIAFAGMCSSFGMAKSGERFISKELFTLAISNHSEGKADSRGLGFQLKGNSDFPMGSLLPVGSYGHTGFTGTSLYVDRKTGLWGVLLTNAVHYGREKREKYFELRKCFYDSMVKEFGMMAFYTQAPDQCHRF